MKRNLFFGSILSIIFIAGGIFAVFYFTKASSDVSLPDNVDQIIFSESNISKKIGKASVIKVTRSPYINGLIDAEIDKSEATFTKKKLYLSPDRKYIAVSAVSNNQMGEIFTHISDLKGNIVVKAVPGSFVSWAPDSSKILLFLPDTESISGRRIYYLDLKGTYNDSGLPEGVISADISPNGDIAYIKTDKGSDNSAIYIRSISNNEDELLIQGQKEIFGWIRWSSSGKKISFLRSNLSLDREKTFVWVMDQDGKNAEKVAPVRWSYPPVWLPYGDSILFSNGNIFEYNVNNKELKNITNFADQDVTGEFPSVSRDGGTIIYSSNISGTSQVWANSNGLVQKVTNSDSLKSYPILP